MLCFPILHYFSTTRLKTIYLTKISTLHKTCVEVFNFEMTLCGVNWGYTPFIFVVITRYTQVNQTVVRSVKIGNNVPILINTNNKAKF